MDTDTRKEIPSHIARKLQQLRYTKPVAVLHSIESYGTKVFIIGDHANGRYEWVIESELGLKGSDCGYGDDLVALRDALFQVFDHPAGPSSVWYDYPNPLAQNLPSSSANLTSPN